MSKPSLLVMLALPGCLLNNVLPEQQETDTFTLQTDVAGVQFDLPAGTVTVEVADVDHVEVTRTKHYQGDPPTSTNNTTNGTLFIKAECPDTNRVCSVDLDMTVPAYTWIAGETGAGDITVNGYSGALQFVTGAGDIYAENGFGNMSFETGAGTVTGVSLEASEVFVESGSGKVSMDVVGNVAAVSIDTSAGDVDLVVPAGTYNETVKTDAGKVAIDGVTHDPTSWATIYVHTGAGNISITGI